MIDKILDELTLEEQVSLLSGDGFWTTSAIGRLGIPRIKLTDGPNGARGEGAFVGSLPAASYPVEIAVGASWNPELAMAMGQSLAEQAKSKGASVLLAPTVNIQRTGLNGRNFECYSEDPHLTSTLATAFIRGVQQRGIAATIKHFIGNESEVERQTMSSEIDQRTLREIYFPPFEHAVRQAGVMAVMTSYNKLNGTHTSEHEDLLGGVLRQEWGFDGVVMSDWFGSNSTSTSLMAGLDLEMPGPSRDRGHKLVQAVHDGSVPAHAVRVAARRILLLLERVGALGSPPSLAEHAVDLPQDRALIRRIGADGAVLLKNDGVLPLDAARLKRVAVIGPNAATAHIAGGGSSQIEPLYRISPLTGIRQALQGTCIVEHEIGCSNNRLLETLAGDIQVAYFSGRALQGEPLCTERTSVAELNWFTLPDKRLAFDDFSARLTTDFVAPESGTYGLSLVTAGRARLYLDGVLCIDCEDGWIAGENYFGTANAEQRQEVQLEANRSYHIVVDYRSPPQAQQGITMASIRVGLERPIGNPAMAAAEAAARRADVALVFVGRHGQWDSEGLDLPHLKLPGRQDELVERIARVNPCTIVVLQTGGPVVMPWLEHVPAVLQLWYPGQELGNAAADVLFGLAEPGGRLPQTFPRRWLDTPVAGKASTYPGTNGRVYYEEELYVGYRHYDRHRISPLFPFGYGLSYTRFEWGRAALSSDEMGNEGVTVSIELTNIGERAGSEVVQLYVHPLGKDIPRPLKELRAFQKLVIAPGASAIARLHITPRDLGYFDTSINTFRVAPGDYELLIGAHAEDVCQRLTIRRATTWLERPPKAI